MDPFIAPFVFMGKLEKLFLKLLKLLKLLKFLKFLTHSLLGHLLKIPSHRAHEALFERGLGAPAKLPL